MGTGSSFPNNDDDFDLDDDQGVVKRIPIEMKPRRTLGGALRSVGSLGRRAKGVSLRSNLSVELDNTEIEKIRKDFEMYKISKKNEMGDSVKKVKKLESENRRLRAELQALQKSCDKLRSERDLALEAKYEAVERAGSFETERNKVQKQFKLYRETKESEIRELMKTRQHLESALQRADPEALLDTKGKDVYEEGNFSTDWWTALESESSVGSTAQIQPWQRAFNSQHFAITAENSLLESREWTGLPPFVLAQSLTSFPGSSHFNLIKVYMTASEDLQSEMLTICKRCEKKLKALCEAEGKVFSLVLFDDKSGGKKGIMNMHEVKSRELSQSSVFVALISGLVDSSLLDECKHGHLNCPGKRKAIFSFYETNLSTTHTADYNVDDLKEALHSSECVRILDAGMSLEEKQNILIDTLEEVIKVELGLESAPSTDEDSDFPSELDASLDVGQSHQTWDSCDQQEALQTFLRSRAELGLENLYNRLNEHILAAGPLPPLLILGPSGSGKSFLLAKWLSYHQKRNPSCLVLYHFVGSSSSTSACVVCMIRRLMTQMAEYMPNPPTVTSDPTRLLEEFPRWLERISSKVSDGVVLVIDSLDQLQNGEDLLSWLLDPLPVDARVIVSARSETCPQVWRSWPNITLDGFDHRQITELVEASCLDFDCNIPLEMERDIVSHTRNPSILNPLFLTVVISVAINSLRSADQNLFKNSLNSANLDELFTWVLQDLERKLSDSGLSDILKQICKLILCSRNGLSESELFELIPSLTWNQWAPVCLYLMDMHVFVMRSGVITFKHEIVRAIVQSYFYQLTTSGLQSTRQQLIGYFQQFLRPGAVAPRITDELPWLLLSTNNLPQLEECISHLGVFSSLYSRGRSSVLLNYWQSVGVDRPTVAKKYFEKMKGLEDETYEGPLSLPQIADLYEMLGKFLKDLGLLNQAVWSFQKALEMRESIDPDHPAVGQCFYLLGNLHAQWGKFATSEAYFKQALMICESSYGTEHMAVARTLESLALLYKKQSKYETAESFFKSSAAIRKKLLAPQLYPHQQRAMSGVNKRIQQLQESSKISEGVQKGDALYELGVLFYWQKDFRQAAEHLEQALQILEALVTSGDLKLIQPLASLVAVHEATKTYDKAEEVYLRILEVCQLHSDKELPIASNATRNLAVLYRKQGKFNQAEPLYKDALQKKEKIFGENNPKTATSLVNLAILYCQQSRHGDASPLIERALKIYEEQLGPNHPRVAETLRNLAVLHYEQGDEKRAAELYKRANEIKDMEGAGGTLSRLLSRKSSDSSSKIFDRMHTDNR